MFSNLKPYKLVLIDVRDTFYLLNLLVSHYFTYTTYLAVQNQLLVCFQGATVDQWPNDHYTLLQFWPEGNQRPCKKTVPLNSDKEPVGTELAVFEFQAQHLEPFNEWLTNWLTCLFMRLFASLLPNNYN